jgi:cytochrome P450
VTTRVVYNIFLHPLRSYPGSVLARASVVESQRHNLKGFNHIWLRSLHEKYGPVVRFAPNKLSFIEPTAWKDVYGHKAAAFQKDPELYGPDLYGNPPGLMRADNTNHARQRRLINHAFSDRALQDQEQLLKGYAEVLVEKLTKIAEGPNNEVDLVAWYNYTTFDIMASTRACIEHIAISLTYS